MMNVRRVESPIDLLIELDCRKENASDLIRKFKEGTITVEDELDAIELISFWYDAERYDNDDLDEFLRSGKDIKDYEVYYIPKFYLYIILPRRCF